MELSAFWLSILLLFVITALGTIFQRRAKDPCLKKFNGQFVLVQLKTGRWVWGRLCVYAKSLELLFDKPNPDPKGHTELSYLLFEAMLPQIQVILHPTPPSNTTDFFEWQRSLNRLTRPNGWERMRRTCRNLYNTLRDAFSNSIGILVGRLRTLHPAVAVPGADQQITSVGQMLVSSVGNSYEPILEKYLGREVVAEILWQEKWTEHVGILEEYSEKYLLVRDIHLHLEDASFDLHNFGEHFDIAFPRAHSVIRHLASRIQNAKT